MPHHHNPKVALVYRSPQAECKDASHVGLGVSALNIHLVLSKHHLESEVWAVVDGYDLWKRLSTRPDITHVVLFAPWVHIGFVEQLVRHFNTKQFVMTCHSNFGFLQVDKFAVRTIREGAELSRRVDNYRVAGNSLRLVKWLKHILHVNAVYLPNLYGVGDDIPDKPLVRDDESLNIGIFGATRILKNMLSAAAGAVLIGHNLRKNINIHISDGREEGGRGVVDTIKLLTADLPGVVLTEVPWLPWKHFLKVVAKMHLVLQPSFTESFNLITADAVSLGVPVVASPAIPWVPASWQANPDDVGNIAHVGIRLLHDPDTAGEGYEALTVYDREGLHHWKKFLLNE